MNHKTDHVFHVWINSETDAHRNGTVEMPIDPHERKLYDFKAAMQTLGWLGKQITKERANKLPLVHQQCSHSKPELLTENYLQCWLGKRLCDCPILKRLRETFDAERQRSKYYAEIAESEIDEVAAMVCVWHMLLGTNAFVDWNEGAVQDVSDRKFWSNVYDSLSGGASGL